MEPDEIGKVHDFEVSFAKEWSVEWERYKEGQ